MNAGILMQIWSWLALLILILLIATMLDEIKWYCYLCSMQKFLFYFLIVILYKFRISSDSPIEEHLVRSFPYSCIIFQYNFWEN